MMKRSAASTRPLWPKLQEHLLHIGVPREQHTLKGLSACFPPHFKIEQSNFDLDTMAEVLLYLVKVRLIKIDPR